MYHSLPKRFMRLLWYFNEMKGILKSFLHYKQTSEQSPAFFVESKLAYFHLSNGTPADCGHGTLSWFRATLCISSQQSSWNAVASSFTVQVLSVHTFLNWHSIRLKEHQLWSNRSADQNPCGDKQKSTTAPASWRTVFSKQEATGFRQVVCYACPFRVRIGLEHD